MTVTNELLTLSTEEWRGRFRTALKILMEDPNLSDEDLSYVLEELGDDIALLMSRRPVIQNKEKRAVPVHASSIDFDAFDSASAKVSNASTTRHDKQAKATKASTDAAKKKLDTKKQPVVKPSVPSTGSKPSKAAGSSKPNGAGSSGKAKAGIARTGK